VAGSPQGSSTEGVRPESPQSPGTSNAPPVASQQKGCLENGCAVLPSNPAAGRVADFLTDPFRHTLATVTTTPRTSAPRWAKPLYLLLGLVFLGIGIVGVFLPLIPTTGPLLLAAFAFARSSERLHHWLVNHPRFGKFISDFQAGRGIPIRTKIVAIVAMALAFGYSIGWVVPHPIAKGVVAAIGVWAMWYVLHLPTADR